MESYSTPYSILDAVGREGADEVHLVGMKPDGDSIVERWRWTDDAVQGRLTFRGPSPVPPRGTPMGPTRGASTRREAVDRARGVG